MKVFIALAAIIAVAYALPAGSGSTAEVVRSEYDLTPEGAFNYVWETSEGIVSQASGDASGNIKGSYKYVSPEGEAVDITYVADENGYQPTGSHIPEAPPVPEAILRALDYIRAHPPKE